MKQEANYNLDFRETITPLALLVMIQVLRDMKPNEVLEITVRDPIIRRDVITMIPGSSCELIHVDFDEATSLSLIQVKKIRDVPP